jgi:hydrogenase maturation protease
MIGPGADLVDASPAIPGRGSGSGAVLVIGVGNLLMGDEGVGIHALRLLENDAAMPGVDLLDGGTGGINLLEPLCEARAVVLIDATRDGQPAGTITLLRPAAVADLPRGLSAHDFGVRDLFAAAALLGRFPDMHVITISVETVHPMCLDLTDAVAAAIPEVVLRARALALRLAAHA